jgi:hypothetical protein
MLIKHGDDSKAKILHIIEGADLDVSLEDLVKKHPATKDIQPPNAPQEDA